MSQFQDQENYDEARRSFLKARLAYIDAKEGYALAKAEAWDVLKTEALTRHEKPTIEDLKMGLLIEQGNPDTKLGKAFIAYANARAERGLKETEMAIMERKYWDSKDGSI